MRRPGKATPTMMDPRNMKSLAQLNSNRQWGDSPAAPRVSGSARNLVPDALRCAESRFTDPAESAAAE